MRKVVMTVGSIGLMAALWGCSGQSDDSAASSGGSGGGAGTSQAGSATGGSSGSAGAASSDGGSAGTSTDANGGEAGEDATASSEAGAAGATPATAAGSGGDAAGGEGGNAETGGTAAGGGATAGTGGTAGSSAVAGPAAVSAITIDTTTSEFAVDVAWTDSTNDATGFNVYLSTDDTQPSTPTTTIAAGTTEYQLTQVQGGATYRVWVEAVNASGTSVATEAIATTPTTDLVWDDLWLDDTGTTVNLTVTDTNAGDDEASLYAYQSASMTTMGSAQPLVNSTLSLDVTASQIDITAMHYFWVEARTASGSLFSLRTLAPAGAVSSLAATPDVTSADLSWDATANANGYEILFGLDELDTATPTADATTNSTTVSNLTSNTLYSFWVRATSAGINGNGFPGPFATVQTTTTQ